MGPWKKPWIFSVMKNYCRDLKRKIIGNKDHLSEACRGGEVQRTGWELRVNRGRGKGGHTRMVTMNTGI